VTSSKSLQHLKAQMLQDAINRDLDTIHNRLPEPRRPMPPLPEPPRPGVAWRQLGAFAAALAIAAVAGWGVSARAVPQHTPAAMPEHAPAAVPGIAEVAPIVLPDPSFLSQPVHPSVLDLTVRRVIVDPGHGGDNLGTSSAAGIHEKDLTLDIGERVRQLVVERGFEAVMTRTTDETLSLLDRAATANRRHGDIFVSIHLNSLRPARARGVETYYLGPSDGPEYDAIAAEENRHSGYSLSDIRSLLEKIYTDARRDESRRLAHSVQRALVVNLQKTAPAITDRGVKTAPFMVLIATEMPSIVAEVSSLSNQDDASDLNIAEYRQTIAEALVSGIQSFASGSRVRATARRGNSGS
jgi:N-acetylmuramoyl-L-alanine amidase